MNALIRACIEHRFLVIFGVLLMGVLGVRSAQQLPIDAVPDVTNVQVQILTNSPALGPVEVEQYVTVPVEAVMSGLPKVAFRLAVPKESNSHVADHVTVVGLGREFLPLKDLGKGSKVLVYGRLHQYDLPNGCGNVIIRAKKIVALQWLPPENPSGRVQELEDDRESWLGWLEAMESDDGN